MDDITKQKVETMMNRQHRSNLIDLIAANRISPQRGLPDRVRHFLSQGLLVVLLGVACAVPVMAAPIQLPAIVVPVSQEHHVGKIIFVELVTPDLAAAKKFYADCLAGHFATSSWIRYIMPRHFSMVILWQG